MDAVVCETCTIINLEEVQVVEKVSMALVNKVEAFNSALMNGFMGGINFAGSFAGGAYDFANTYLEMRSGNLIDSDKYFHSKANYKASLRGEGGEYVAEKISNMREIFDQRWPKYDSKGASMADQKANLYGRSRGAYIRKIGANPSYSEAIPKYRKSYFPSQY